MSACRTVARGAAAQHLIDPDPVAWYRSWRRQFPWVGLMVHCAPGASEYGMRARRRVATESSLVQGHGRPVLIMPLVFAAPTTPSQQPLPQPTHLVLLAHAGYPIPSLFLISSMLLHSYSMLHHVLKATSSSACS